MFSKTYDKFQKLVGEEECIFIVGKPESSGDSIKLQIEEAYSPNEIREKLMRSIKVYLDPEKHNPETISLLKNIFQSNSGNIPVYIHLSNGNNGSNSHIYFLKELRVKISDELIDSITNLIGEDSILFYLK